MFRQLPRRLFTGPGGNPVLPGNNEQQALALFLMHPLELVQYLEGFWDGRIRVPSVSEEDVFPTLPFPLPNGRALQGPLRPPAGQVAAPLRWAHLIYAYMVENTRVYEIFRRVLKEYRHGEKLGAPFDGAVQRWLRTTEQLFYSDPAPFLITNISSHIRADMRASRRNAYQRLLGMELNHGEEDGKPYSFIRADAANSEFVTTFEEFLREVWVGISNAGNTSGANPTDNSKIAELATKIHDMLRSRRQSGNLAREEYASVSMMAWFHLTLQFDSPIVRSLRAEASGVENRLFRIAERVGLPAHGLSKHFFEIADPLSRLLIQIETRRYNNPLNVPVLYQVNLPGVPAGTPNRVEAAMRRIITHWTAITGRDVKARKVAAS